MAPMISGAKPAATALSMARALASVPPLVNTRLCGSAPTKRATVARAVSTSERAARPLAWTDDGLAPMASARATASAASGRICALAL